ncbi:MAG: GldM family protein [Chitinophagales bacterium]
MQKICTIVFILLTYIAPAQHAVVSAVKVNVLFAGIENPFTFAVNGKDCSNYIVETNNGKISYKDNCKCTINPDSLGTTTIYLKAKNGKVIDSSNYRTIALPDPVISVTSGSCGHYYYKFCNQNALKVYSKNFEYSEEAQFSIKEFSVLKYHNDTLIASSRNYGAVFSTKTKEILCKTTLNDVIYFEDIIVIEPNKKERKISGIAFKID